MEIKFFSLTFIFLFFINIFASTELKMKIYTLANSGNALGIIYVNSTDKISDIIKEIQRKFNIKSSVLVIIKNENYIPGGAAEFVTAIESETLGEIINRHKITHDTISVTI